MSDNQIVPSQQSQQLSASLARDLFKDIDFTGINAAIEAIANHSGDLDKEGKQEANKIIDQWAYDVVDRLQKRNRENNEFIHFFDVNIQSSEDKLETIGFELAERTNSMEAYNKLMNAIDAVNAYRNHKPIKEEVDIDDTITTQTEKAKQFEKNNSLYEIKKKRLENERKMFEAAWKREIRETELVKQLLKDARNYSSKVDKFSDQCKDKAQLAKLNVSITSSEIRKSLRELLDFTIKL